MTHIKTWQERAGTFKETYLGAAALAHADTHLHVQAELNELRSALAQQGEQAKPAAYITDTWQGPMVWTPEMYNDACTYCDDGEFPVPLYTAAPAAQAQPVAQPLAKTCDTCAHYQQGTRELVISIHDDTCYGCSEYYANKWEAKSD